MTQRGRRVHYVIDGPPPEASDIIMQWSELQTYVPAHQISKSAEYLSRVTGVALDRVHHLRVVRNACAHPATRGWPSDDDVYLALGCASQLRGRLDSPRPASVDNRPPVIRPAYTPPSATPWSRVGTPIDEVANTIAFSPDGRLLASGFYSEVVILDTKTLTKNAALSGHDSISELAFSADGGLLASAASNNIVRIWQPEKEIQIATLLGHDDRVRSVAFSPDGRTIATGSGDKTAKIWKTADWRQLVTLPVDEDVLSVAFHPDGSLLATSCRDVRANIKIWNTRTWAEATVLTHQNGWSEAIAFSPDGSFLVSGGNPVMIWDTKTWQNVATLTGEWNDFATCIAVSPDGRFLACAFSCERFVKVWRTRDWVEVATLTDKDYISSVAFSPDSRYAATGAYKIQLFDVPRM